MAEPDRKRLRITPRNSTAEALPEAQTPFQDLHQLGKLLRKSTATPQSINRINVTTAGRKALSSGGRSTPRGTPGNRTPNLRSIIRSRRGPPTTPHAIRAQQVRQNQRNYGTPGRDRRRSGRVMRDTPRDDLRMLSRALAGKSERVRSESPHAGNSRARRVSRAASFMADEESPVPDAPRLSLGRREMADDDDSWHEAPPRMSMPLDEYEVEGSRREYRRDRESFGGFRLNDFIDAEADIVEETEDEQEDEDLHGEMDEYSQLAPGDNETTRDLRALMDADQLHSLDGDSTRHSFGGNTDGEPTFQFRIADRSRLSSIFGEQTGQGADLETVGGKTQEDLPHGYDEDEGIDVASQVSSDNAAALNEQLETERTRPIPNSSPPPESPPTRILARLPTRIKPQKKTHRSRFGIEYPSLPGAVVKKVAGSFSRSLGGTGKINKETLGALTEASDWFFEQVSEDLGAYADHARRKRIEDADVITLMKRQRQLNDRNTVFSIAQKLLPGELLQAIKMPPMPRLRGKKRKLETVPEEEEEE